MNKFTYNLPNGVAIESIVMDETEFEELCKEIEKFDFGKGTNPKEAVDRIREAKHIPMVSRGSNTEHIFKKYEIKTPVFCACVRGMAERQGVVTLDQDSPAIQIMNKSYDNLTEEEKSTVEDAITELLGILKNGDSPEKYIIKLIGKHLTSSRQLRITMIEQVLMSLATTIASRVSQDDDPFRHFDGYLRRLVTSILVMKKEVGGGEKRSRNN